MSHKCGHDEVNPKILRWARENAGLSVEEAASALRLGGVAPAPRLAAMEAGERSPTRRQLEAMSAAYRRPLLTFYLAAPPAPARRTHDFRTLPEPEPRAEARLRALVRDVTARQTLVRGALEDLEEEEPLPFVGAATLEQGSEALAEAMQSLLEVDLPAYRAERTVDTAFRLLREATERAGVFVVLMGNLGHHARSLDPDTFRGLALADPVAPFIVINENDSRSAWSFTLLHELAHILLGQTGVSGYHSETAVERICDRAAARFLLRTDEMQELPAADVSLEDLGARIGAFAQSRHVSRKMVAYNLLRAGSISAATYGALSQRFDRERRDTFRPPREGGADYYVVRRHRIGAALTRLVERMVASGVLTSTKAGRVLGVKPTAVERMTSGLRAA